MNRQGPSCSSAARRQGRGSGRCAIVGVVMQPPALVTGGDDGRPEDERLLRPCVIADLLELPKSCCSLKIQSPLPPFGGRIDLVERDDLLGGVAVRVERRSRRGRCRTCRPDPMPESRTASRMAFASAFALALSDSSRALRMTWRAGVGRGRVRARRRSRTRPCISAASNSALAGKSPMRGDGAVRVRPRPRRRRC